MSKFLGKYVSSPRSLTKALANQDTANDEKLPQGPRSSSQPLVFTDLGRGDVVAVITRTGQCTGVSGTHPFIRFLGTQSPLRSWSLTTTSNGWH